MSAVFEDVFMDIQTEMVQIGVDLVGNISERVEKIYILGVFGEKFRSQSSNVFFKVGNRILSNGKVTIRGGFASLNTFFDEEQDQMFLIKQACESYGRPVPYEIRLVYDLLTEEFEAEYGYEEIPFPIGIDELYKAWMEEEQAKYPMTVQDQKSLKKKWFKLPFLWKK